MLITSRANERVKQIRALRDKRASDDAGAFFAEGRRLIQAALDNDAVIELLVVAPDRLDPADETLVLALAEQDVPLLELTGDVFDSVSFRAEAQSMGAVVQQRWETLEDSTAGKRCWVALHDIQHPGNLGTVIRTNDAIGGDGVILSGHHTDPYHPIAVRGTLGAIFSQRLVHADQRDLGPWAKQAGVTVVGTSPWGTVDYREVDYASKPVLLISGSERIGLTDEQLELCDAVVRIPMAGQVETLNLAVATALVLYEVLKQNGG
jgi:TrmH family RNA methyltransferase